MQSSGQIADLPALAEDIDLAPDTRQALDALLEIRQVDEPDSRFDSKSPAFTDWGALAHLMHSSAPVVATPAVFTLLAWVPSYRADNRASDIRCWSISISWIFKKSIWNSIS